MSSTPSENRSSTRELTREEPLFSKSSLAPVWQLNAYFLETLAQSSRHPAWRGSAWDTALGPSLAEVLPAIREELCRTPVSLVDIGLNDVGSRALLCEGNDRNARALPAFLARDRAIHLAQVSLSLAWTLSRSSMVATSIVFGLSMSRAKEVSALAFHGIAALSERLSGAVRPRWLSESRIWRHLLSTSERAVGSRLAPTSVRILQRQFSDLIPATSATHFLRDSRP